MFVFDAAGGVLHTHTHTRARRVGVYGDGAEEIPVINIYT